MSEIVLPAVANPLVVVTVGTDHHPFDRLVRWSSAWLGRRQAVARGLIQVGTARPPADGEWARYLPTDGLEAAMAGATAVVSHGGPATIAAARDAGLLPIVVPRTPERREHVDDHQVRFTEVMAAKGRIVLARSEEELHDLLDHTLVEPDAFRAPLEDPTATATARQFGDLIDALLR